jgi:hypothetical protein
MSLRIHSHSFPKSRINDSGDFGAIFGAVARGASILEGGWRGNRTPDTMLLGEIFPKILITV